MSGGQDSKLEQAQGAAQEAPVGEGAVAEQPEGAVPGEGEAAPEANLAVDEMAAMGEEDADTCVIPPEPEPVVLSRVAVLETSGITKVIYSSVVARCLRRAWPGVRVVLFAPPGLAQLAKGLGFHQGVEYSTEHRVKLNSPDKLVDFLHSSDTDALVVPQLTWEAATIARRSKIDFRLGFAGNRTGVPLSGLLCRYMFSHAQQLDPEMTYVDRLLSLLQPLDVPLTEKVPVFRPEVAAKRFVTELLDDAKVGRGGYVVLAPGADWATRRWPEQSFARLADKILDLGAAPVVLGHSDELPIFRSIRQAMGSGKFLVNAIGLSLEQGAELNRRSRALVSGDNGLLHLGMAAGAHCVALFGPSDPSHYAWGKQSAVVSRDISCRPCSEEGLDTCPEKHHNCLRKLTSGRVLKALLTVLK